MVSRIVSGGQTGVDRAALDVAMELGIPHGGWCPRGRRAEDGTIPARYQLVETDQLDYSVRTEANVLDSDGTLILYKHCLSGGTRLTDRFAVKHHRPCLCVDLTQPLDRASVSAWIDRNLVQVLNVAGPRESTMPGIAAEAAGYLYGLLQCSIR